MADVSTIKAIIGSPANNKDTVIQYLIDGAEAFAKSYCNITDTTNIDNTIIKMVIEDFNRMGSEGLTSQSFSGTSENYNQDYSAQVYKVLNKNKKIKML